MSNQSHVDTLTVVQRKLSAWLGFCLTYFFITYFIYPDSSKHNTFYYVMILVPGLLATMTGRWNRESIKQSVPLITFIAFSLASLLWSPLENDSSAAREMARYSLLVLTFPLIFILGFSHIKLGVMVLGMIGTASIAAAYSIFDFYFVGNEPFSTRMSGWGRLDFIGWAGTGYLFAALAGIYYLVKINEQGWITVAIAFSTLILISAGFLSYSRMPIGAFIFTAFLVISSTYKNRKKMLLTNACVGIVLVVCFTVLLSFNGLLERGMSHRTMIHAAVIEQGMESPWIGVGLAAPTNVMTVVREFAHAHGRFVAIFYHTGLVGVMLFLLVMGHALFWGWRHRKNPVAEMAFFMLIYGLLCSVYNGDNFITRPNIVWLTVWLPYAVLLSTSIREASKNHSTLNKQKLS